MSTPEVTASAERDGSYVIRVKLPGVTSAKEVSAVVEDDPAIGGCRLEVISPPEALGVPRYRLSHPVPFVALVEGASPDVKFGKKTATLTVTFERIDEVRVPGLEHFETNDALYLATHPTKGRCVRARREINPGETILRCAPFVHVVHDRRKEDHCAGCFKTLENAVECVECGEFCGVKYCADVCRESDVAHVAECSMVRTNAGTGVDLRGARMCLRLIHRRTEDPERFAKVMNALRCEKKSPTPAATRLASAVRHRADVNPQEVEDMLGKTRENSHGVVDWKLRQLGTGIYPEASMFNHSCAPNAVVSFAAGGKLNVCCIGVDDYEARAMEIGPKGYAPLRRPRPIRKGEEVCIAYTELYRPAASRRLTLEKSKGFTCECVRCANVSVLKALDTELHAAMDGVEEVADEMAKELEEGIDASRAAYAIGDFEGAVESAERVLESSDGVLRDGHFLRLEARLAAIEAHIEMASRSDEKCKAPGWRKVCDLCVPTLQHLMTHLPLYHPGTVEITKHFGLAMLMVSAELADGQPDHRVRGDPSYIDADVISLPNHNLVKLWINSTSAFCTHGNVAQKVYGCRVLSGLNAPDDRMHDIKRVGGDTHHIAAIMKQTANTGYGEKVQVDYAFMDGSLPPLPESFSNFRAPPSAQMSPVDQAANIRAYGELYNMKPKQIEDMLEDLEEYHRDGGQRDAAPGGHGHALMSESQ